MTKVSIIVPLYNMEKTIAATLNSLCAQSYQDIEIICVNDGSTDTSLSILESYQAKDERIKIITKSNGGISSARNVGLEAVTTDYFMFVDSDDIVEANYVEKMLNKAIETNAQMVISDFYWTYPKKEVYQKDGTFLNNKELLVGMFATLWNKLYDTQWVKSLNLSFPEGYRYEDASFLYKLIPHLERWAYVNEAFVHYIQREGSITHTHNDKVKDMIYVFEDLHNYYQDNRHLAEYQNELEYLFIRFFLGNSFLRSCQIKDKQDRIKTLNLSYSILNKHFPTWKKNSYLKRKGLKNLVFRAMSRKKYFILASILHKAYQLKAFI
jgi:glycosyltransferase involved in cell wall biosynthesis